MSDAVLTRGNRRNKTRRGRMHSVHAVAEVWLAFTLLHGCASTAAVNLTNLAYVARENYTLMTWIQ